MFTSILLPLSLFIIIQIYIFSLNIELTEEIITNDNNYASAVRNPVLLVTSSTQKTVSLLGGGESVSVVSVSKGLLDFETRLIRDKLFNNTSWIIMST